MAHDVSRLLGQQGWITGPELLSAVSRSTVSRRVDAGTLVRLSPAVFALPSAARDWRVRAAAALHGRNAVASHATALALWELIEHPPGPVHVTVARGSSSRGSPGVVVHRTSGRLVSMRAGGLDVSSPARAVVDNWGARNTHRTEARAAAISAVRRRLCSARELARELDRSTRLSGRAHLIDLVRLLADGCQSELEIWGCSQVLRAPGMPTFVQQRRLTVDGATFLLDARARSPCWRSRCTAPRGTVPGSSAKPTSDGTRWSRPPAGRRCASAIGSPVILRITPRPRAVPPLH